MLEVSIRQVQEMTKHDSKLVAVQQVRWVEGGSQPAND